MVIEVSEPVRSYVQLFRCLVSISRGRVHQQLMCSSTAHCTHFTKNITATQVKVENFLLSYQVEFMPRSES